MKRALLPALLTPVALVAAAPAGINRAHLDTTVKPTHDFFRYAVGTWQKQNPIPADQSSWGAFNELAENNRRILRAILEEAARTPDVTTVKGKVGAFFAAGMDEAGIEKLGLEPLKPRLAQIENLPLHELAAAFHTEGTGILFNAFVGQDDKDSSRYILQFFQGGLGLPDRDFYVLEDAKSKEIRTAYVNYMASMLRLLGEDEAAAKTHADQIMDLETRMAKASMTLTDQRDPNAIYHKMSVEELAKTAPGFPWADYLQKLGVPAQKEVLVRQPGFFKALAAMAQEVPVTTWRTYARFHLVDDFAGQLPAAFGETAFGFHGKVLNGLPQQQARWKRIQAATDGALGEAVGQLYVEKAFSPEAKTKMLTLVEDLRSALGDRIRQLPWMSPVTKKAALQKLAAFRVKIGYPDRWKDYSKLEVRPGAYLENVVAGRRFAMAENLAKLGKPIDRNEWGMTPQTVNAYYDPSMNEIVFPAGILQPPFFDLKADDAVNYGAIGMVIGHEMTHGFDDQGRQYDDKGNLRDWWTEADAKAYNERAAKVEAQYNAFEALPGLKVNGKLTLGENIADLGGLKIAFEALKKQWARTGKPAPIDGFTGEQRFFLGYAQSWRFHGRDEAVRMRVMTDPHSPAVFRVNGPLSNMSEFFDAFAVPKGTPMRRADKDRPTIW